MISVMESSSTLSRSVKDMKDKYKSSLKKIKENIKSGDSKAVVEECDNAIGIIKVYKQKIQENKSDTSKIVIRELLSAAPSFLLGVADIDVDVEIKDNKIKNMQLHYNDQFDKEHIAKGIAHTAIAKGISTGINAGRAYFAKDVEMKDFMDKAKVTAIKQCNAAIKKLEEIKSKYK